MHWRVVAGVFLIAGNVIAAKPGTTGRWFRVGKREHQRVAKKSAKERDRRCHVACKKAGARKPADLGACKEGCVFG